MQVVQSNAQSITVHAEDYKQIFYGAGGTSDSYMGHWLSMSAADRDLAARMVAQDIHLDFVKNYINGTPETHAKTYDNFASFVNDIKVYNPNIKVQISIQDLPDELEKSDGQGGTKKGEYDPNIPNIFDKIAQYYYDVLKGFQDRGVTVHQLDLLNEPGGVSYAVYYGRLFSEAVPRLKQILATNNPTGIPTPEIAGVSSWAVTGTVKWFDEWKANLPEAYNQLDVVTTHGYQNGWDEANYQEIYDYINGLPFQNNEQTGKLQKGDGLYEVFGQNEPDYIGDVSMAMRISDAINGGVNHFFIFNLSNSSGNNAALLRTPRKGTPSKSKVYSGFKQVTSTQPARSHCIGKAISQMGKTRVVCFRKQGENEVYMNITNISGSAQNITIDVDGANSALMNIDGVQAWVSDQNRDEQQTLNETYSSPIKKLVFNAGAYSVNTLKLTVSPDLAVKENVVLNKPVRVSSSYNSRYVGSNAVDGDKTSNSSRWLSGRNQSFPQWIEVDLQGEKTLSEVSFWTGYNGYSAPITDFEFQVWNGSSWSTVFSENGNNNAAYSRTFSEVSTSKVRLMISGAESGLVKLFELEVMGVSSSKKSSSSAESFVEEKSIDVYPNPTTDFVNFTTDKHIKIVRVFSSTGQMIKQVQNTKQIDVQDLKTGVYYIQADGGTPKRIIKQ